MSGVGKTVCVTGASGFVASHLVKLLLQRGYFVKASVRSLNNPTKTDHLVKLDGAKERLHFFEADLLKNGSFDAAINGCDGVFHTASPFFTAATDPEKELIEPALKGTLNVLGSCSKYSSVKRVVVTSSVAAVAFNARPKTPEVVVTSSVAAVAFNARPKSPEVVVDETWFSDPQFCREMKVSSYVENWAGRLVGRVTCEYVLGLQQVIFKTGRVDTCTYFFSILFLWYVLSKTLAEEAAWKFAEEKGLDIVTINPAMVIGPLLQPTLNTSAAAIAKLLNGSETYPNSSLAWVNVKDVANAHIQAFEIPSANGRYCLVENVVHYSELIEILRKLYPSSQLPENCENDEPFDPTYQVSKEKAKSLGIDYIPLEQSIKETVESLKEKNFLKL